MKLVCLRAVLWVKRVLTGQIPAFPRSKQIVRRFGSRFSEILTEKREQFGEEHPFRGPGSPAHRVDGRLLLLDPAVSQTGWDHRCTPSRGPPPIEVTAGSVFPCMG